MKRVALRIQGTSSLAYPRKNFRFYTRVEESSLVYDYEGNLIPDKLYQFIDNAQPVDCWCLKADFAESSGTHNTGIARIWNKVMYGAVIQHTNILGEETNGYALRTEAQKIALEQDYKNDVRTTIDGFPIVLFYKQKESDTDLIFLGKYNFNNDKSTPSVFGFENIPGFDNARMQCWETKDNGHPLGLFTDVSNFDRDWSEAFESRYPDTKTPNTADLKAFSQWMSTVSQEDFATQKWAHMDVYKVAAYYVYLMRFGAVDQPVKNGFLTSEDGQKFYYINYDNDTINGLINTGELRLDPTITRQTIGTDGEYVYAGHSSVLWNRCEADTEFMDIVSIVDNALYSAGLRYDEVMSVFNDEQCDKWAERVYNQDAEYKYLLPYVNQATNNLFMLQGSRSSHRSWWLSKRFALYDSLFVSGAYRDRNVSFKCLNDTQPGQKFTITAGTDMNYGYGVNNGIRETGVELNSGDTRTFTTTDTLNLGDVVKIFGASDLAQLDLSQLASRLAVLDCSAASDTVLGSKMKKLLIGGNGNVNTELSSISGINKLTSLQELNIEDYQAITSLDLTALKDMRKVYAHGSGVASIDFAPGTPIEHLELPSAMLALNLNQLPYLTTNNLVVENGLNSVNSIAISGCPNLSNNFDFAFNWLTAEENLGKEFFMDNIEWKYASVSKLIEIGQVMAANPKIKLMGKVIVLSITIEQIDILRNLFGDNVFENFADFSIKAPESIFLSAPESINEGESAQFLAVIFSDFKGTVEYSIYSGSRTGVTIDSATGLLSSTETGYSDSTLTIRAVHTSTAGVITFVDRSIRILKRTYPTSIKISGNSNVGKEDVYTASISPTEYTGNPIIVWTVTGVAVTEGYLEMVSQSSSECRVRVLKRDLVETKNATVKCSIYKSDGATLITEASKTISVKAYTYPTSVSISGPDTIRRSDTYNLVYSPTSFDGEIINVAWAVSDDLVSFAAIGEHDEHHCEIIITDTVVGVAFGTISVIIMLGNGKELTASKDVTILDSTVLMTSQSNSGAMAAMYASGLCANKDYMTYEEAAAVTNETIQGLSSIGSLYDFVEFEYFTGLTEIPDNAFNHVRNLRQIKLPPQITRIGKKAFGSSSSNHTQLTSITIPDNVKLIDEGAFSYIPQLKSLDLGNGVERIAQRAFYETSLTSLHIPPSVKILETHAFNGTQAVSGGVGLFQLKSLSGCVGLEQLSFGAFGRIFAGDVVFADEVPFGKFNHDYPDLFVSGITSDAYLTILYDKDLDVPIVKDGAYFDDKSKVKTIKVTRESDRNINTLLPVGFSTLVISSNLPAETFRVSYIHIDTEERVEEILPVGSHLLRMKPDYGKVIVSAAVELEDMELLPMEHGSSHYTWLRTFEAKFFERVTFYIQRNDGTLYTEKEWDDSGLTYIEANGIAAIHKDVSFVVNKSLISGPGFV